MSDLTFKIHISADGFIGRPDGDLSWLADSFADTELATWETELLWRTDLHLMGRVLYEDMAAHWPQSDEVYAAPMNEIPKAVLSQTLTSAPWADDRILGGNLSDVVRQLKSESRDGVLLHGGATIARDLARLGLIDRWVLIQHPVALGSGLSIFDAEQGLQLESSRVFHTSGVTALTYAIS